MPGIEAEADVAATELAYVRAQMDAPQPPPASSTGVIGWLRANLFSSWINTLLTLIALWIIWSVVVPFVDFALINAVWTGANREVCTTVAQGGIQPDGWFGACWPYVRDYFAQFIYGRYPFDSRWRVDIVFALFAIGLVPLLIPSAPFKSQNIVYMVVIFPIATLLLLTGGHFDYGSFLGIGGLVAAGDLAFAIDYAILTLVICGGAYAWVRATGSSLGAVRLSALIMLAIAVLLLILGINFGLQPVETSVWGGLLVTLVIAITGIAASLPIGIVLALGRRSNMPIVRAVSVAFIEFWRGVPLITVLFMSSVMLPLFLPEGVTFDKLLRALIGVALFSAAYMAEVVRGGLQAIPKGQYEGADAVGLAYWQKMRLIILPQALTLVIPGIVNTFIGLFKDTTLVLIIGLFDFLGQIQSSFADSTWASPVQATTAYLFAAMVYWVFCFSMSRYSIFTEHRLATGHER
jgi:general L-amino acid transport system permease protein